MARTTLPRRIAAGLGGGKVDVGITVFPPVSC